MNLLLKDMKEHAFLLEIQRLAVEMDLLIDKYDVRDKVISVMVTGLIDEKEYGESQLKAIYSYSLDSRNELESIMEFIDATWSSEESDSHSPEDEGYDGIDDLLDGTGIELE
tara:strand:- start:2163 stop:2498 length:336 start_codon:yes stop_codon:yes gene_type:complete